MNVCGQFWFNDSANGFNQTGNSCFTVTGTFPTLSVNGTNITIFRKNTAALFFFNWSDNFNLSKITVENNMTLDGIPVNTTCNADNKLVYNCTVNVTMVFGNTTQFYLKVYANDSRNQINNSIPRVFYTTVNTLPIVSNTNGIEAFLKIDRKPQGTLLKTSTIA